MKIYIDTREQQPLEFKHEYISEVIVTKLEVGDYAVQFEKGYIVPVRFERKGLGDLYGTLGKGYDRFKREIERAREFELRLIILIECSLFKVLEGYEHSKQSGDKIVKQLFMLWEKYDIMPVFCQNREECSRYIIEFFSAIGRKAIADLKEQKKLSKENKK